MSLGQHDATHDPFEVLARFYDLDLEGFDDDIALYLGLLEASEGPAAVLELGCGTGRVAGALAEAGAAVTAVDLSPDMLARAQASVGEAVRWIEGDMRTLDLDERYDLVLVPLGGLQHLETPEEVADALATVARHLAPVGVAVVDVEAPHADDWLPGPHPLVEHWTRPGCGGNVTKWVAIDARPSEQLRDVTYHFDVQGPDGGLRRHSASFTLRVVTVGEIALAARLAGLRIVAWYGDYEGSPPRDGDERIVALLEAVGRGS